MGLYFVDHDAEKHFNYLAARFSRLRQLGPTCL